MTSQNESMPTMEVLVSTIDSSVSGQGTVTALADTGASLCVMSRNAWSQIAGTEVLKKSNTVIGLVDLS